MNVTAYLQLEAFIRRSIPGEPRRTSGKFNEFVNDNADVFRRYFDCDLFPGSLNIDVPEPEGLWYTLDQGKYPPAFIIPHNELTGRWMPSRLGNGQAWRASLEGEKIAPAIDCWVFRRIHSRVPREVLEIVAPIKLSDVYNLRHGDPVNLTMWYD